MVEEPAAGASAAQPSAMRVRLDWIDIAKGFAIFLVVVGHTVEHGLARQLIFSVHMPAFFILAGYTLRAKPWASVFLPSVRRLLVPYALIVAVTLLPAVLASAEACRTRLAAMLEALVYPAGYPSTQWTPHEMWAGVQVPYVAGGFYGVGMAWFLLCLFLARMLANGILLLLGRFGMGQSGIAYAVAAVSLLALGFAMSSIRLWYWPFDADLAVLAAGFMFVGQFVRRAALIRMNLAWTGCVAGIAWWFAATNSSFEMSSRGWEAYPLAIAAAVAGTFALCHLALLVQSLKDVPGLRYLEIAAAWAGRHSLDIYAMHAIDGRLLVLSAMPALPYDAVAKSLLRFGYDVLLVAFARKVVR